MYLSDDWFDEESVESWRTVLDDLIKRGPQRPQFLIVDGAAGLEKAIDAVWDGDRCNDVHEPAGARARAPARGGDRRLYRHDLATTPKDIGTRHKAFIRKWRLAPSPRRRLSRGLEEAGDRLFTFVGPPP